MAGRDRAGWSRQDFLYGAAYYYEYQVPEEKTGTEPRERMKRDFALMREAGMNLIRIAESTWSTLEKEEGKYTFDHIDPVLGEAQEAGLSVIIGTPTYAVPSWLVKKHPEIMAVRRDGQVPYGARQSMDILNPDYREAAGRAIAQLVSHTASSSCVIGWQIDNETKHYDCYSGCAQKKFRKYLEAVYETPERLNETFGLAYWSNSIASWEDFPDMRGCINGGLTAEYLKFMRTQAAEFLAWQAQIVRRFCRPDQIITHNLDFDWTARKGAPGGCSNGVQSGIDHYEVSSTLDVAGCDIYHPSQDNLTGREIAFGGDEIRSLKQDSYLVLETQSQGFQEWTPYPGQLRLQAYSHIASGAAGVEYWNWNSLHNSFETYWRGILGHDLHTGRIYREIASSGSEIRTLWPHLRGLRKQNRIALVISAQTRAALDLFPVSAGCSCSKIVRWVYNTLYENNIECDVVYAEQIEEHPELLLGGWSDTETVSFGELWKHERDSGGSAAQDGAGQAAGAGESGMNLTRRRYDLVITPGLYSAGDELIGILRQFTAEGGVLLSTFKSFFTDEHLSVRPNLQPYHMADVFGVYYQEFTDPGTARVAGRKAKYFAELLQPVKGGSTNVLESYEHPVWGSYAAVTENRFHDGYAYYVGTYVPKSLLIRYVRMAMEKAGIGESAERQFSWPVILRSGENEAGRMVHFLLYYSAEERDIAVPYEKAVELVSGEELKMGDLLHLKEWDVKILME